MATSPAAEDSARAGIAVPVPYRLTHKTQETPDTWTLELEPAGERHVDQFRPGQFAMLYAFGTGESPISLSGGGQAGGPLVHTVRAVGAVTATLCGTELGECIGVRGPFGTGWPVAQAEGADLVLVAGGLGLPPLRPAVRHALAERKRYGQVALLYGGRSPDELVHKDELGSWRQRPDLDLHVTVDSAGRDWRGSVGLVTSLIPRAAFDPGSAVAMVVGPEPMMRFTVAALRERGVRADRIYVSLERSMKCATGVCGHCMIGPEFVCKDGPVFAHERVKGWLGVRNL